MTTTEAFEASLRAEFDAWRRAQPDGYDAWSAVLWATERAAKVVEDTDVVEVLGSNSYYCQLGDASATRDACAAAIRARDEGVRG